jgi:hypothetical protein
MVVVPNTWLTVRVSGVRAVTVVVTAVSRPPPAFAVPAGMSRIATAAATARGGRTATCGQRKLCCTIKTVMNKSCQSIVSLASCRRFSPAGRVAVAAVAAALVLLASPVVDAGGAGEPVPPHEFRTAVERVVAFDLGLRHPQAQLAVADESSRTGGLYNLSLEELRLADADYLFVYSTDGLSDGDAASFLAEVRENPVWSTLSVVQNGRAHVVDDHWFAAGYIAADAIMDDIERLVLADGSAP